MASTIFTVFVLLFLQADRIRSQGIASCNASTGYEWSYNSLNQDPCVVATLLGGVCNSGEFSIPALNSTESYAGPTSSDQSECRCSTVYFSVLMACAACQGAGNTSWSGYSASCSSVYAEFFPQTIPPDTAVEHWAYLNVSLYDGFNATAAQLAGDSPESTGAPQPTVTSASTASSKSDKGAIAGGVVGGIIFLLIVAAAFWFIRKRRSYASVSHNELLSPDVTGTAPTITTFPSTMQQKIYDPSDPTTFPTPASIHAPYSINEYGSNASIGPPRTYPGYAEV